MPILPGSQVQAGEASVAEDRRRILHAICGGEGDGSEEGCELKQNRCIIFSAEYQPYIHYSCDMLHMEDM